MTTNADAVTRKANTAARELARLAEKLQANTARFKLSESRSFV